MGSQHAMTLPPSFPALLALFAFVVPAFAQGPLTPTGAPAPSGRSLEQIEPRIPIPVGGPFPYTITQKGSYYLTGNVSVASGNAIVIQASDVTLDLGGFSIASTSATLSGTGILLDGGTSLTNISIANGFIRGTSSYSIGSNTVTGGGFQTGIGPSLGEVLGATGVRVSSLGLSGLGDGIRLNPNSPANVVEKTTVQAVQGVGIRAGVVADSSADRTGGVSIESRTASNVAGSRFTAGDAVLPVPVAPLVRADVEPRTAIPAGTSTYTISTPGSYVLTGNLTVAAGDGITITADNVTLDLGGYTIASTAASPNGIGVHLAGGRTNVAIANGHIRGTRVFSGGVFSGGGFTSGIDYTPPVPRSIRVSNVSVTGVNSFGIDLGANERSSSIVQSTVRTAGALGLRAGSVADSAALEIGGTNAVSAGAVSNVYGSLTGAGTAVVAVDPSVASVSTQVGIVDTKLGVVGGDITSARNEINAVQNSVNALATRTVLPGGGAATISASGSYVLGGNITVASGSGIVITADNVTLDLNGFTVASTGATGTLGNDGIFLSGGRKRIAISNGFVRGAGFYHGIGYTGTIPTDVRVTDVTVTNSTDAGIGLSYLTTSLVIGCTVGNVGGRGIEAQTVVNCSVRASVGEAIYAASVTGSTGETTGLQPAVRSLNNPTITTVWASVGDVQDAVTATSDKRTQIPGGSAGYVISQPGSYVLAGNLTVATGDGIQINASHVTLDLNGFTLRSNAGSATGSGVFVAGNLANVAVRNGVISGNTGFNGTSYFGGGFFHGLFVTDTSANVRIEGITGNNLRNGIVANVTDGTSRVQGSSVTFAANLGIWATTVVDCTAARTNGTAISGKVVSGSRGSSLGFIGVEAETATNCDGVSDSAQPGLSAKTASNCVGTNTGSGAGLAAVSATNSRGVAVSGTGLFASQNATGCTGESASGIGLDTWSANLCQGSTAGTSIGLRAVLGVTCRGSAGGGGTPLAITNRYLMP